jgi:hypothetical protein
MKGRGLDLSPSKPSLYGHWLKMLKENEIVCAKCSSSHVLYGGGIHKVSKSFKHTHTHTTEGSSEDRKREGL